MDWKMLLIGAVMLVAGGFLGWRFRKANFATQVGPGCAMSFALILMLTGVLAVIVGLMFKT